MGKLKRGSITWHDNPVRIPPEGIVVTRVCPERCTGCKEFQREVRLLLATIGGMRMVMTPEAFAECVRKAEAVRAFFKQK